MKFSHTSYARSVASTDDDVLQLYRLETMYDLVHTIKIFCVALFGAGNLKVASPPAFSCHVFAGFPSVVSRYEWLFSGWGKRYFTST